MSKLATTLGKRLEALKTENSRLRGQLQADRALSDPNVWLESVTGDEALAWVKERNAACLETFGDPKKTAVYDRLLSILDSKEKIPYVSKIGDHFYNFWRDEKAIRGIWRRTTLDEYKKAEPAWEIVLDLDAVGQKEGENWVWKGQSTLDEGPGTSKELTLLSLSRGGADATVVREFNLRTKEFVTTDAFALEEAKSRVSWRDRDTLLVGSDFGPGSLTSSGYPRQVKVWKRGTPLDSAALIFEGQDTDVSINGYAYWDKGFFWEWQTRAITFYTSEQYATVRSSVAGEGAPVKLAIPEDCEASSFADQLMFTLRSDWSVGATIYAAGSLLACSATDFLTGGPECTMTVLFEPSDTCSLESRSESKNYCILSVLDNVCMRLVFWQYSAGTWAQVGGNGVSCGYDSIHVSGVDSDETDEIFITASGFTLPSTLYLATVPNEVAQKSSERVKLKALPEFFKASDCHVEQHFATSKDGTRVPYFQVCKKDTKMDGRCPTLLYGYGGFEISLLPGYAATVGVGWLEQGGCFVEANIRGGGEYGPKWHQAALKENRSKAYEDFIAVAEHLISRGLTSPKNLGIQGGSNGGLLMGNMLTMRPDLFGAIVCQVPLLDMQRFHLLLAGASWQGEYGDPDVEWEKFLHKYSPYHNLSPNSALSKADRGVYPPIMYYTSTRDDRVHPGHARKMVKRMLVVSQGKQDLDPSVVSPTNVHYYENIEGGHGGAADNKQSAFMRALSYTFFWEMIGGSKL